MRFVFLGLFILVYGALNYYIGLRGWQTVGRRIPGINSKIYWLVFWAIALSYIMARLGRRILPDYAGDVLDYAGSYWMAAMLYFLLIIAFADMLRFVNKAFRIIPEKHYEKFDISFAIGLTVFVTVIGILGYGAVNARKVSFTRYNISIPKQTGNLKQLRIALVSDIHLGRIIDKARLDKMVDAVNSLNPDIVLISGDILDEQLKPFIDQDMGQSFRRISSKYGVFAALGNHDYYSGGMEDKMAAFQNAGIKVLRDSYIEIDKNFYILGREDKSFPGERANKRGSLSTITKGMDKTLPVIMLDHQPVNLGEADQEGIDLQLSGHTHQGQFFPIDLITNRVFEVDYGYMKKNNLQVIVTSGYGTWGPPIRVGNSSEIADILVRFK